MKKTAFFLILQKSALHQQIAKQTQIANIVILQLFFVFGESEHLTAEHLLFRYMYFNVIENTKTICKFCKMLRKRLSFLF